MINTIYLSLSLSLSSFNSLLVQCDIVKLLADQNICVQDLTTHQVLTMEFCKGHKVFTCSIWYICLLVSKYLLKFLWLVLYCHKILNLSIRPHFLWCLNKHKFEIFWKSKFVWCLETFKVGKCGPRATECPWIKESQVENGFQ